MSIFSKAQKQEELTLVFDIGSSSVGGSIFFMQNSGIPKIICSFREPISFQKNINFDHFLLLTSKALSVVSEKIYKKGLGAPKNIFCVLSSPWYASQIRNIKLEKDISFIFNLKLADSLIEKEVSSFEEEYLANNVEKENKFRFLEKKNIKTMLNGYAVENPFDKKTKEVDMLLFVSVASEKVLQSFENAILKHFHFKNIRFSSFAMASFVVARDVFAHEKNFLLVDIGGEVTDISMIKDNTLRESMSFPLGPNFIMRELVSQFRCSPIEARSLISFYKDDHMNDVATKKLDPIMNKLKTTWLKKFQETLTNLSSDVSIPSNIFITVEKDFANFFSEIIKNEQLNQYILTESKFKVVFLDAGIFHDSVVFLEDVDRDPFLMIETIYLNRFFY